MSIIMKLISYACVAFVAFMLLCVLVALVKAIFGTVVSFCVMLLAVLGGMWLITKWWAKE